MSLPPRVLAVLVLLSAAVSPQPVSAQEIRRCVTDGGRTVYTDRACREVGGEEGLWRATAAPGSSRTLSPHGGGCSRSVQDLMFRLTAAIDQGDANALASLYHWPGIGNRAGYAIMDRLDAIARRPLVHLRPLFREPDPAPAAAAAPAPSAPGTSDPEGPPSASELMRRRSPWRAGASAAAPASAEPPPAFGEVPAHAPPRPAAPHALQVEQTLSNSATPSRTVFGLRRHMDCWWLSL